MRILIDMNLSPAWVQVLGAAGYPAVHWSTIGSAAAPDTELLAWASAHSYVVFTHDLDFGMILAATSAHGPSVIQLRSQDVTPQQGQQVILDALPQFKPALDSGALISIDHATTRVRVLPLR